MTRHGYDMSAVGGAAFNALRDRLKDDIGLERLAIVEDALQKLVAPRQDDV
ncbi:MAG TPA: hypothetical protein VGE11_01755 [Pseudonocardia sp.]